ncbi:Ferredoxin-dependent glutamate synthase 1 [Stieleria neptunia]|uniref:Ferredoxin-dependent glutamate synthase 1 n=1 Tax=Stieleria neptunia TaxID=2527979 RepID=A0A518HXX5_9BACT|nr:FMN-binding glutamate synthase family protein [Stieleria neptunia]QDV45709.1 Ferredoxin-dependent glutamate synthase 1 [Stieleria neptunia]
MHWVWTTIIIAVIVLAWVAYDVLQKKHAILHNFPIIGHFRYWLEAIGPELRQYIVTNNDEERPFSRDQRRWVYASSKKDNNYFGFGTDNELESSPNYLIIRHSAFPLSDPLPGEDDFDPNHSAACKKVMGATQGRAKAFRPDSIVNISAMSFGSLSAPAIEALNRGAALAGCLHNTGEGGVSPYHGKGGELIWQIGTGYFGCRTADGRFDIAQFRDVVQSHPIRAIEIKLSQGAKPGRGGLLPAAKISPEISRIRGVPMGKDCASPASHREFSGVDSMLDFVERLAQESGLPVGIKSAVGQMDFWYDLAGQIHETGRSVDFVTIDGGEGGTGAAPLVFSDHVAMPFKLGMSSVYRIFRDAELHENIVFIGSGKLGFPHSALLAFGLGCDMINVGREAMLSIGCIQAQRCHTGHCPAGIATQNRWLMGGLDPTDKSHRFANYVVTLRKELLQLGRACGVPHPCDVELKHFDILSDAFGTTSAKELFGYRWASNA